MNLQLPASLKTFGSTISRYTRRGLYLFKDNSSTILGVLAGLGVVETTYFAIKESPKAKEAVDNAKTLKGSELTVLETVAAGAPELKKTAFSFSFTEALLICSLVKSAKDKAALVTAVSLAEERFRDLQNKNVEILGEKKASEIQDAVAIDSARRSKYDPTQIIHTGRGDNLFYDPYIYGWFRSSKADLDEAYVNTKEYMLDHDGYAKYSVWAEFAGLPYREAAEYVGFNKVRRPFEMQVTYDGDDDPSIGRPPVDEPYGVVRWINPPEHDYEMWY